MDIFKVSMRYIYKIIAYSVTYFSIFIGSVYAQDVIITDIIVEGNQRVEDETVKTYISIRIGEKLETDSLNQTIKNIYSSGFFSDVRASLLGTSILIKVIENPIINRIAFEGNNKIDDEALQSEIRLASRSIFTRAKIQDEVERIVTVYRRNGRFDVKVEPKVITLPQNRVDIVFEIAEGENTEILSINFIGNKFFSDRKLREIIITRQTRWYSILTATDRYDPDQLSLDREELRRFYLNNGFADFVVESAVAQLSKEKEGFNIIFTIIEGGQYTIKNVIFENLVDGVSVENIMGKLPLETGEIYSANDVETAVEIVTDDIILQGYPFIEIFPEVERVDDDSQININLRINPSEKKYVSRIEISGNDRTIDSVIRRNMRLAEGDAIIPSLIARSRTLITNLGFFESVDLQEVPTGNYGYSDINVNIVEKPTGELSFGAGYSTSQGGIGNFGISENNFLGRGQKLNVKASLSSRRQNVTLGFVEPYFFNRDVSLGTDVYDDETHYKESHYKLKRQGFSARTGFTLSEYLSQSLSYSFENRDVNPESNASASIQKEKGETLLSSVGTSLTYDTLDNRMFPSDGYQSSLSGTLAGLGGDKNYLKVSSRNKYYYPYDDKRIIFGLGMEAGAAIGFDEDILVSDRFFLGGNNFRGFAPAGVGPRDSSKTDALGGNYYYVGTARAEFGIGLPQELGVKGSVFSYVGSLSGVDTSSTIFDDFSPRISSGLGISWQSPFGPISLTFTKAIVKETYDKTESFNFGIGTNF